MKFLKCILSSLLIASFFYLNSCGPEKEKKDDNVKTPGHVGMIIFPNNGQVVTSGDDITLEFSLAAEPENFSKVVFKVDNNEIHAETAFSSSIKHTFNTASLGMGLHVLSAEVHYGKKDPEINTVTFLVTSDIVPKSYTYMVRNKFSHDIDAYTQGLEFSEGKLYEGTGLNGKSELREVDLKTGRVVQSARLEPEYFGEGITVIGDKIYQVTYQSNKGFVYDRNTLKKTAEFSYATEGWGLTHDDQHIIMSDGTNKLYFLDKYTYERKRVIEVYDNIGPVNMLNELEMVENEIWANVYLTQNIMRIDPKTGKVLGVINCSGIFDPSSVPYKVDVLNGIAYEPKSRKIYFTGKLWPNIYEVEILNAE